MKQAIFPFLLASSNLGRCSSLLSRVSCARSSLTKIPGGLILLALLMICSFCFQSRRRQTMVLGRLTEPVVAFALLPTRWARSISGSSSRLSFSLSISFTLIWCCPRFPFLPLECRLFEYYSYFGSPNIFDLLSVVIEGTAHLFNLFFDLMHSGWGWFQVLDIFLGELKARLLLASVFLGNI